VKTIQEDTLTNDPKCNHGGTGEPVPRDLHPRLLVMFAHLQEPPAWLVGLLTVSFVLQPVLACGHAEAYRRLRVLLALVLIGLALTLLIALASRLPLTELLT
jgi:hypothetical protein